MRSRMHAFEAILLLVLFLNLVSSQDGGLAADSKRNDGDDVNWQEVEARLYIQKIFERYGDNGMMSFEGFEHLLEGLGLGNLVIEDHDIEDHKVQETFQTLHKTHNHTAVVLTRNETDKNNDHHHWEEHHVHHASETEGDNKKPDNIVKRSIPQHEEHDHEIMDEKCLSPQEILHMYRLQANSSISVFSFMHLCPAILYQIDHDACHMTVHHHDDEHIELSHSPHHHGKDHDHKHYHSHSDSHSHSHGHSYSHSHGHSHFILNDNETFAIFIRRSFFDIPGKVWGYAILAVTVISLVGLLCVAIVPVINKMTFDYLIQFLVALAVGTLTGDALLHLIPHSIAPHNHEGGAEDEEEEGHNDAVFRGCMVLGGIYLFFIMERMMGIMSDLRKKRKNKMAKHHIMDCRELDKYDAFSEDIGEKLSRHNERINSCQNFTKAYPTQMNNQVIAEENLEELKKLQEYDEGCHGDVTIEIGKHGDDEKGQGHSHGHGHSHDEAPKTVSSIAWMVIMGDGLHNFTDGLAIGAAFGASISVGLSTSIAVFCHELPHELGDFAVLLKAGMSVKLALFYNIVSSVLCFIGLVVGVAVGNISEAGSWIFALTAGIFLYISLVDMLPEITTSDNKKNKCCHLVLQILGITTGVAIMLVIALFESDIKVG